MSVVPLRPENSNQPQASAHAVSAFDDHDSGDHGPEIHDEHEGGHDEPWLVSYADMMTLLFGFFVIMYSFAAAKNQEQENEWFKMKKEFATYFGGEYTNPVDKVAKEFKHAIESAKLQDQVKIQIVGDMLEVIIQSKTLFPSGQATVLEPQIPLLNSLFDVFITNQTQMKNYSVVVEGHTDDVPIENAKFRSNWDLSSARAATVAMMLQQKNYNPSRLSIRAFGEFQPLAPNRDPAGVPIEENRAKNRRIVLKLVADKP